MRLSAIGRPAPVLALALLVALTGCRDTTPPEPDGRTTDPPTEVVEADPAELGFRNAVNAPPEGWDGPVFELSHDYPTDALGDCAPADCPWLTLTAPSDFTSNFDSSAAPGAWENSIWPDWMETVKNVIRQGQDDNLTNEAGFRSVVSGQTAWYHVPWMAYDPTVGREFVHGTTNERTSYLSDLLGGAGGHALHTLPPSVQSGRGDGNGISSADCEALNEAGFETWAVGMYNGYGGYALGQTFTADGRSAIRTIEGTDTQVPAGLPFPTGTLVTKFLFTTAPVDCVDYLVGAPEWTVNRHVVDETDSKWTCERQTQTVRLVQVDVAAVDPKSPTRWIYGTFAYNGLLAGSNIWDRLEPVGIQWGSDSETFPAVPETESQPASHSILNVAMTEGDDGIYQHFGCRGRLAGPVDNELSSCMSCHASAYAAIDGISQMGDNVPNAFGYDGMCTEFNADNVDYFFDNLFPNDYNGGAYTNTLNLDTSMQLSVAFTQYQTFDVNGAPNACHLDDHSVASNGS